MQTRQQAITYGLSFPHTYVEAPFKDPNWELVRVKGSKKAFLWIYEKDGYINLNIKVDPEWRDFWREAYDAVIPGYHQNTDMSQLMGRGQLWQETKRCQEPSETPCTKIQTQNTFHASG